MKNEVTLVIGNGFDIGLELETSFSDFMRKSNKIMEKGNSSSGASIFPHLKEARLFQNWIDVEKELKKFVARYHHFQKPEFIELVQLIKEYLDDVDNSIEEIPISKIQETKSYRVLEEIVWTKSYEILNFNYTKSVEYILEKILKVERAEIDKRLHYVHGSLKDDNIVIGVDESFDKALDFPFLVKFQNIKFQNININNKFKESMNVVFFGHSIGETDHSHFDTFFSSISEIEPQSANSLNKGVFVFYYGEDDWDDKAREINILTKGKFKKLMDYNKFIKLDAKSDINKFDRNLFIKDPNARTNSGVYTASGGKINRY
ncbi:hypothetical protein EGI26_11105 [Lacihabitans sp. CCS-44]|uniref:AbiH family protein n=1 Tax=Lacihabitans sp. CCS-44 TaxID=2487331 RepID=UPI0020CB7D0F|nr:AbiH family protein [Lacihabitans sp. CCS-44]MCP9755703.1 hypothetical protein [Lacihabitans sp. CCS-44]